MRTPYQSDAFSVFAANCHKTKALSKVELQFVLRSFSKVAIAPADCVDRMA